MKNLIVAMLFFLTTGTVMGQISNCFSVTADFENSVSIEVGETTTYTAFVAESSGGTVDENEIEIVISFPGNGTYINTSLGVPTGTAAGLFTWSWNPTDKTLYGINPAAIGPFGGGTIILGVEGVSMTAAPEVTNVNLSYAFNGSGCADNNDSDLEVTMIVPVEMISFNSRNLDCSQNLLEWATATEDQNAGFEIQRSLDGVKFEAVGFVEPVSPSDDGNRYYSYTDDDFEFGVERFYYRLKQMDFNGAFDHSEVKRVTVSCDKQYSVSVYPNPTSGTLNYNLSEGFNNSEMEIRVIDGRGVQVFKSRLEAVKDLNASLELHDLSAGLYTIRFISAGHMLELTFIKLQ